MTTRTSFNASKKPKMKAVKPPKAKLGKKDPTMKKPSAFTKGDSMEAEQRKMGKAANRKTRNKGRK